jgi:type III restriction enzyme
MKYFDRARQLGAKAAFVVETERPYRSVRELPDLPYVCLRLPTGGGKTILAAHAVGVAAESWLGVDHVVALWLVPSNAIREQTLTRLKTIGDPYREALESRFKRPVSVLDITEALSVQRATLDSETVIIVATLAALRKEDTEGLRVYRQNGSLLHHFESLDPASTAMLSSHAPGVPVASLENVLRLRRPIVIVDEAHNARTTLSFETLARFAPSCVIEFTATPETKNDPEHGTFASNVLAHVSAAELKAEQMIKLPVKLVTRPEWTDAVGDALAKQRELEAVASAEQAATGERIRPIVLFQAQSRREGTEAVVPELLRQNLIADFHVPADQIAIETGTMRDLDGVDINDLACPIRYVITVQALREGWDCPMAYILCSIAEQSSPRAVEQLLGRVLRMPSARRKHNGELNAAYAFVVSNSFASSAANLRDALVEAGFERLEADGLIEPGPGVQGNLLYASSENPVKITVANRPSPEKLGALHADVTGLFSYDPDSMELVITSPIAPEIAEEIAGCFASAEARQQVHDAAYESRTGFPAEAVQNLSRPKPFNVPLLGVRLDGNLELLDDTHFADDSWRLASCDPALTSAEFPLVRGAAQEGELDVTAQGRIELSFHDGITEQLALLEGEPGWDITRLAVWLDQHIPHPDITPGDAQLFIHNVLTRLIEDSGVTAEKLAREKYRLRKAIEARIAVHRSRRDVRAFQHALFDGGLDVVVDESLTLGMGDSHAYAPNWLYEGSYRFRKHLHPTIGEMESQGQEYDCAVFIDEHPQVESWVRNLTNQSQRSFWLQTSTDRFYPDFVGLLKDGRIFAVEYKNVALWSNDDSKEKRTVGALWAERSKGRCVFVMPSGPDWSAINAAFAVAQPSTTS